MKSIFANVLGFSATTAMGVAIDFLATTATATTAPACINCCAGEATALFAGDASPNAVASPIKSDDEDATPATSDKRWSEERNSLCFTSSSLVMGGGYAIYLDGWGQEHDGCGKGALDNLRGQCGNVWYWTCRNWGSGVLLTFYLAGPPRAKCAVDTMWLASPKDQREEGLCCVYLGSQTGSMNTC